MYKRIVTCLLAGALIVASAGCHPTADDVYAPSAESATSEETSQTESATSQEPLHDDAYYSRLAENLDTCLLFEFASPAELTPSQVCTLFQFFDDWDNWENFRDKEHGIVLPYTYVWNLLNKHLEYDLTTQIRSLTDGHYGEHYDATLDAWIFPGEVLGFGGMRFSKNASIDRDGDTVTIVQDFYDEDFQTKQYTSTFVIREREDYYVLVSIQTSEN
ncbi:MAG: hypothetical protein IJZ13_03575 [Clostridia bacterium]|nr:hypothetical protein [Clostridia bacterium]